jgi:glycosyltransferase involved in cell wall biosynthesis
LTASNPSEPPGYLIVLPWDPMIIGGVNEVVRNLCREFHRSGRVRPTILENSWEPGPIIHQENFTVIPFRLRTPCDSRRAWRTWIAYWLYLPGALRGLANILRERNVAIINPMFPDLCSLQFVFLKALGWFGGKIVLSFQGLDIEHVIRSRGVERMLFRLLFRSSDAIVTCSDAMASQVAAFSPEVADRVRTIHNSVDIDFFLGEASSTEPAPSAMTGNPLILHIGAFEHKKGQDILIEAFPKVLKRYPEARLFLLGKTGPIRDAMRDLISSKQLDASIRILGDVPHAAIPLLMKRANLFVLPSRSEGLPIVLLEAGACQLPVVAAAVSGIPELIRDNVHGRLVPAEDPVALANAILELLANPPEMERLARNLYDRVRKEFTWKAACEEYLRLLPAKGR